MNDSKVSHVQTHHTELPGTPGVAVCEIVTYRACCAHKPSAGPSIRVGGKDPTDQCSKFRQLIPDPSTVLVYGQCLGK